MNLKGSKKLIDSIDEKYVLLASEPESVFRKKKVGALYKKIAVIAACIALVAAMSLAALIPAMREAYVSDDLPISDGIIPEGDGEYVAVEDGTLVNIIRLSAVQTDGSETAVTEDGTVVNIQTVQGHIGDRFILLQFQCNEGEQIIVSTGERARVRSVEKLILSSGYELWAIKDENAEYRFAEEYYYVPRDMNNKKQEAIDKKNSANRPQLPGQTEAESLPETEITETETEAEQTEKEATFDTVTVASDDILIWQYAADGEPCMKDNFVDFKIVDAEGNITGGGSIYIGGLDLVEYTGCGVYEHLSRANLNAIYRPALLGSYRFENDSPDETEFNEILDRMHQTASEARKGMFDDLRDDSYKIVMRKLLAEQNKAFCYQDDDGSSGFAIGVTTYAHNEDGTLNDRYAIVENRDRSKLFFIYGDTYQAVTSYEEGCYDGTKKIIHMTLEDGTKVIVRPEETNVYQIIPPSSNEST
ncbi:MAG: hypothetical protein IJY39_01525 [Clostridia bacterium]|nr:hypothetical protein [Clostridia bacterium]